MYVGIDYHKRFAVATKMNAQGNILEQVKLTNTDKELGEYLRSLPPQSKVAVEATGNWYHFYEMIEDRDLSVTLAHPYKTRAIASARIKTDKVDSTILAHLLRTDLLPAAYIPPREIRDLREVLRYRASLVALRTSLKNRVHALISKNGLRMAVSDLFGKKGLAILRSFLLRPAYRQALDGYLACAEALSVQLTEIQQWMDEKVQSLPNAKLLRTMPGIGDFSALLILAEIGSIDRFPSAKHLCSYAGLVPSVHASGGKTRLGRLTKQGSKWLRWILVENSLHAVNGTKQFRSLYYRVQRKHGTNTARVAVARQMLRVIFAMLKHQKPFEDRHRT